MDDIFERAYKNYVARYEHVNHERLKPILGDILLFSLRQPLNRSLLVTSLMRLSDYLRSAAGRDNAHLSAVDQFFADGDDIWRPKIDHIPEDIRDVMDTIGIDLHGGLTQPEFHTTPEQLADMVKRLSLE